MTYRATDLGHRRGNAMPARVSVARASAGIGPVDGMSGMSGMSTFKNETESVMATRKPAAPAAPATGPLAGKARTDAIARIGTAVGIIRKNSADTLADILALCQGIPSADFAAKLGDEIGHYKVGKVLPRGRVASLVKALRDDARNGGKVNGTDVASVLGISTGQVSALNSLALDDNGEEMIDQGNATGSNGDKTASDLIDDAIKLLKKAAKRDDARSDAAILAWQAASVAVRQALPGGADTNNRGGQA